MCLSVVFQIFCNWHPRLKPDVPSKIASLKRHYFCHKKSNICDSVLIAVWGKPQPLNLRDKDVLQICTGMFVNKCWLIDDQNFYKYPIQIESDNVKTKRIVVKA
jgi:hypothetical protein